MKKELIFLILGLAGLIVFVTLFDQASPTASLDFKLSRGEVKEVADGFLRSRGYSLDGYRSSIIFDSDGEAAVYTEKELGLKEANLLFKEEISIWYWWVRCFKPLEKEEFFIYVDPAGKVIGFKHKIEEDRQIPSLSGERALETARDFLKNSVVNTSLSLKDYELVETRQEERKRRVDHYFEWKRKDFRVKDASYRLTVDVYGERIGGFSQYLKVPEKFRRQEQKTQAKRNFLTSIFGETYKILMIFLLVIILFKFREHHLRWRFAFVLGVLLAAVSILASLNSFPLTISSYNTTQSFASFTAYWIILSLLGALGAGLFIIALGAGGEALHREVWKNQVPLSAAFTKRYLRGSRFLKQIVVGYAASFLMLGYVTLFYIVGRNFFGVWSPAASPYYNIVSTRLPWIYPLLIGLSAALNEEFFFRLFSISFFKKFLKRSFLAVIISAVIWAFLHSNYRVEPIYIRGIELTIFGLILGYIFLKYGIISCLVTHYVYNALLVSLPLLRSTSLYFKTSGIAVVGLAVIPAIPAICSFLRKERYIPVQFSGEEIPVVKKEYVPAHLPQAESKTLDDATEKEPQVFPAAPEEEKARVKGTEIIKKPAMLKLALLALIGLAVSIWLYDYLPGSGRLPRPEIDRTGAVRLASAHLKRIGISTDGFSPVVKLSNNADFYGGTYLLRKLGTRRANQLLEEENFPFILWRVNWYEPEEIEGMSVSLDERGEVRAFSHRLPEDRAAESLSDKDARVAAEKFVKEIMGVDLTGYELIKSSSKKRKERVDHYFTWKSSQFKIGEMEKRLSVTIQGDRVDSFAKYFKPPERFVRDLRKTGIKDALIWGFLALSGLFLVVSGLIIFFLKFRHRLLKWRVPVSIASVSSGLAAINILNRLPLFMDGYVFETSTPIGIYITDMVRASFFKLGSMFIFTMVTVSLCESLYKELFPDRQSILNWFRNLRPEKWGRKEHLQAILLVLFVLCVLGGLQTLYGFVEERFLVDSLTAEFSYPVHFFNSFSPVVSSLASVGSSVINGFFSFVLLMLVLKKFWSRLFIKKRTVILLLLLVAFILSASETETIREFAIRSGFNLVQILFFFWLLTRYTRFNFLVYIILFYVSAIAAGCYLVFSPRPYYLFNGIIICLLFILPLVLIIIGNIRLRQRTKTTRRCV